MNPDADIMWLVHNSEPKLPFAVALYDGRPSYRMVKVFAINNQLWRDPCPRWERNVISWTFGSFADLPYQFCEEIYVVLNDLAFNLDHGVTFIEPVDGLISNNDDDSCFPAENNTDVYNSDNTDEEVYEDSRVR